jgi:hypothetical protein
LYGSWFLDIVIPFTGCHSSVTKVVRLILMEYIEGTILHHMLPQNFYETERYDTVRRVYEAEFELRTSTDVAHYGIVPRNVMICDSDLTSPTLCIVLFDFSMAKLKRWYAQDRRRSRAPSVPPACFTQFFWSCAAESSGTCWLPVRVDV